VSCAGTYTVTVYNSNGCSGTATVCVTFHSCGGCGGGGNGGNGNNNNSGEHGGRLSSPGVEVISPAGLEVTTYPNPMSVTATIEFRNITPSSATTRGTVEIYTFDGRKIAELFSGDIEADKVYQVKWSPADVPDGTYLYRIVCGENVKTGTLVLMKK
jgi:hypothetical protein